MRRARVLTINALSASSTSTAPVKAESPASDLAVITFVVAGMVAIGGFLFRWLFLQVWTQSQSQIAELKAEVRANQDAISSLKSTLPIEYVCREDFLRGIMTLEAKIDRLEDKLGKQIDANFDRLMSKLDVKP